MKHVFFLVVLCCLSLQQLSAQNPPAPPVLPPEKEAVDHTADNEKLAKEIQKAIDRLNELKDADKIEILKKIKKHIEDNKKTDPEKNLDDAVRAAVKKGERNDWLDKLVRDWKRSLGILTNDNEKGWKTLSGNLRVSNVMLEPIIYEDGPLIEPDVHAYFTFEMQPGDAVEYLNARLTDPEDGTSHWLVQNVPLPTFNDPQTISYRINIEAFDAGFSSVQCDIAVGDWQSEPDFIAQQSVDLVPQPTFYHVSSGSSDPAVDLSAFMFAVHPVGGRPGDPQEEFPGCDIPNVDLDYSSDPSDEQACGPAAAANSLHWLVRQHSELSHETSSLRAKVDSLKDYMCHDTRKGVRFDSMVVGKLTLIDKLKLPIHVKYQTKHPSGDVVNPLASTEPPQHTAENKGSSGTYPDFDWVKNEIDKGEDVEMQVGWYGPEEDGGRKRHGGHWVVLTGYFSNGMIKGVYAKDDSDQSAPGGLRHEYFPWAPGAIPYLEGMVDADGNVAIIESAVSESYDPSVTFDENQAMVKAPWSDVVLTGERMKPGYPFLIPDERTFPWIPVIGGVVGVGVVTYIVTDGDDDPTDCTFTATAQVFSSTCNQSNGSATISVSPADTYSYAWSNGGTSSSIGNVQAGSYTVTITRSGTNCNRIVTVDITNTEISLAADLSLVSAHCGQNDGSASISINPAGQYNYAWSNGGSGTSQSNLASGTYMVTVSLESCSETYNLTVGELPPQFDINIHPIPASCGMSDGSAVAVVTKGDYTFLWSNGHTGAVLSDVPAGEYAVTVTINGTSCQKTSSVVIGEMPADFTVTFDVTQATCGESDGAITATVSPTGQYDFLWSNGNTTASLTGVPAGEYQLTVTLSGTTCVVTSTVQLPEDPAFNITITTTPSKCGISDGSASVTVDPPGIYNYIWPNGSTEPTAENLAAGSYVLTVTNNGGCTNTSTFTITATPADFIIDVSTVPGNCLGEGADVIVNTQTHGAGPLEFTLTGPDGVHTFTSAPGTVNVSTFFTILPGPWQIVVRDMSLSADCNEQSDVTVEDNTMITVQADQYSTSVDQPVSGNVLDNDSGLSLTVGDHTEPAGGTLVLNSDGSFTFIPPAGVTGQFSFQYQVTDVCGNTGIGNVTIVVNSADCTFDATFTVVDANCGFQNGTITTTMTPAGEYTFQWSTGASSQNLSSIGAATFSVTITSVSLMCNKEYVVQVNEVTNNYIEDLHAIPGNCTGEGDIIIVLSSPGAGPLVVIIDAPPGTNQFTLPTGGHNLSSLMNITSGIYSITVYDEAAGELCSQTINITVPDNTPAVNAMDDVYQTPFNTPVDGNVLDNDSGLDLTLTDVTQIIGGLVDFNADGSFTFTPDPGFSGLGGFMYTVTDACGTTATAFVEITVEQGCDFTAEFTSTNSACGLETGSASVVVDPPGTYFVEWSNGETGETITNVGAGVYSVTIEDLNLGCSLTFDTEINENPAEYVSDLEVIQPMCPVPGDIRFTLSSPSNGPFEITIVHPDGTEVVIEVPAGQVSLLEYIPISDGTYSATVIDVNAGPACSEEFTVTLEGTSTLEIMVEAIIPPSEPTAMDGAILVTVTIPTTAPYTIFLNGVLWGVTPEPFAAIEGVGAGTYQVQLQDANGCFSNILEVVVPPSGPLNLEIGFGLSTMQSDPLVTPEQPTSNAKSAITSVIDIGLHYRIAGITYLNSFRIYGDVFNARPLYRFTHLVELWEHEYHGYNFKAHGGLSVDMIKEIPAAQDWTIQGSASKRIGKVMTAHAMVSLRGWTKIELPVVEVGVKMPVMGK